jgi:hypothetical protein
MSFRVNNCYKAYASGMINNTQNPQSGRVGERLEPVSGRSNGVMQCNGKKPFERAGVRRFYPKAKPQFPKALCLLLVYEI